jgi:hypothetical protein
MSSIKFALNEWMARNQPSVLHSGCACAEKPSRLHDILDDLSAKSYQITERQAATEEDMLEKLRKAVQNANSDISDALNLISTTTDPNQQEILRRNLLEYSKARQLAISRYQTALADYNKRHDVVTVDLKSLAIGDWFVLPGGSHIYEITGRSTSHSTDVKDLYSRTYVSFINTQPVVKKPRVGSICDKFGDEEVNKMKGWAELAREGKQGDISKGTMIQVTRENEEYAGRKGIVIGIAESLINTYVVRLSEKEEVEYIKAPDGENIANHIILPEVTVNLYYSQIPGLPTEFKIISQELGSIINSEYKLGQMQTGTEDAIAIERDEPDIIGTYHTHYSPQAQSKPGIYDLLDFLRHNDKIQCVGATGLGGTKIQCFNPIDQDKPNSEWNKTREELIQLISDIKDFNKQADGKYHLGGRNLRKLLTSLGQSGKIGEVRQMTPEEKKAIFDKSQMLLAIYNALEAGYQRVKLVSDAEVKRLDELNQHVNNLKIDAWNNGDVVYNINRFDPSTVTTYRPITVNLIAAKSYVDSLKTTADNLAINAKELRSQVDNIVGSWSMSSVPQAYLDTLKKRTETEETNAKRAMSLYQQTLNDYQLLELAGGLMDVKVINAKITADTPDILERIDRINNLKDLSNLEQEIERNQKAFDESLRPDERRQVMAVISEKQAELQRQMEAFSTAYAAQEKQVDVLLGEESSFYGNVNKNITDKKTGDVHTEKVRIPMKKREGGLAGNWRTVIENVTGDNPKDKRLRNEARVKLDELAQRAEGITRRLEDFKKAFEKSLVSRNGWDILTYKPNVIYAEIQLAEQRNITHEIERNAQILQNEVEAFKKRADDASVEWQSIQGVRTEEYNAAVNFIEQGNQLEIRRTRLINKLENYLQTLGTAGYNNILQACKLLWEEEIHLALGTKMAEQILSKSGTEVLVGEFVRIKATGEVGKIKKERDYKVPSKTLKGQNILGTILTIDINGKTKEYRNDEVEYFMGD